MQRVYYLPKDIYGFMSYEDYRDLKYGVTKSAVLQCGLYSYIVTIDQLVS